MPPDRIKNLPKVRNVVTQVHARQEQPREEPDTNIVAVANKELRALERQTAQVPPEPDDHTMESDRSSQSDAPKSSDTVGMKSAESIGPPASASEAAAEARTGSLDEMSVDLSAEKSLSAESMSSAEVAKEDDHDDGAANADETLYDIKEPDSDSSKSNSGENIREIAEAGEVSSKHSLEGAESLPDDDAEKKDCANALELELQNSEDVLVEKAGAICEVAGTDPMDVVTEQLAEADIETEKIVTPKTSSQTPGEVRPAKIRPRSFKSPQKGTGRRSSSPKASSNSLQNPRILIRRLQSQSDTSAPSDDSSSLIPLRTSSPEALGRRPSPNISIVVTPPKDDLGSPKE